MTLKLDEFPPGGWQFFQPETGWSIKRPMEASFHEAVNMIVKHRRANPVLAETATREQAHTDLIAFTRARLKLNEASVAAIPPPEPTRRSGCRTCPG
jgi:hypothetical protein